MAVPRVHWEDLPDTTRQAIERHTGPVVEAMIRELSDKPTRQDLVPGRDIRPQRPSVRRIVTASYIV
jgi:hypothetical protein